ncbi:MAG: HTH domain-containing protein, partial [Ignavibacteria bacterium]|nr:HTH domain-containing protein [Ignavibacteria bacterium]
MDLIKQKRQIEILAMCLPDKRDRIYVSDLVIRFNVGEATINRDLQDLRKRNIPINSVAKRGIVITDKIEGSVLKKELLGYIGHFYSEHLIEAVGGNAGYSDYLKMLEIFVTLNMAVESRKIVKIIFKGKTYAQAIEPLMITRIGGEWELIMKDKSEYLH